MDKGSQDNSELVAAVVKLVEESQLKERRLACLFFLVAAVLTGVLGDSTAFHVLATFGALAFVLSIPV